MCVEFNPQKVQFYETFAQLYNIKLEKYESVRMFGHSLFPEVKISNFDRFENNKYILNIENAQKNKIYKAKIKINNKSEVI